MGDLFLAPPSLHFKVCFIVLSSLSLCCACQSLSHFSFSSPSGWPKRKLNRLSHSYLLGREGPIPLPPHRSRCLSLPASPWSPVLMGTFPSQLATCAYCQLAACGQLPAGGRPKQLISLMPIELQPGLTGHRQTPRDTSPAHRDAPLRWLLMAALTGLAFVFQSSFPRSVCISTEL